MIKLRWGLENEFQFGFYKYLRTLQVMLTWLKFKSALKHNQLFIEVNLREIWPITYYKVNRRISRFKLLI